ncbi:hypothetical protein FQN52_004505 [Onygenales sp. PD_12]|nr:hypothetical protein FQN52_004505 [Onygenales sp. PD_12]
MFGLRDIIIALVWLLLVVVSRLWWKLAVHRRRFGDLPKPPHSFLFGHIALYFKVAKQLAPDTPITVVFDEIRVQYNLPDVYYIDLWPLTVPFLITGDLAVANKFLNDYLRHPASLVAGLQSLTGGTRGLVSAHPYEWHSARSMIRPVFSVTNVQRFIPDMAQYSMQLRTKLVAHAKTSRPFPLIKLVEQWGADLTFRFILGQDAAVQQDGWGADINNRFQAIIAQADGPFTIDPLAARQHRKVQHRLQAQVREKIRNILLNALHSDQPVQPNNYVSLVDSLAAKHREEFPGKSEWDDILTQHMDTMMTLFLAADISSMVLTYVFCHLAQNPDVVTKLREEHNAVFHGDTHATLRAIQENPGKIKELLYTSAVIKESLRLRPPGISPTMAPKGHTVTYNGTEHSLDGFMLFPNLIHLQLNDLYMSSPHTFDPGRWLPYPSTELADTWRPFQRGHHSCMGENMMMPGLAIALLLIVRDINVALAYDPGDVRLSEERGGFAFMTGSFASKPSRGLPVVATLV